MGGSRRSDGYPPSVKKNPVSSAERDIISAKKEF
jgi:hypothetical protein